MRKSYSMKLLVLLVLASSTPCASATSKTAGYQRVPIVVSPSDDFRFVAYLRPRRP